MGLYKRGKIYYIRFEVDGNEIRESTGSTSRAEALAYERRRREEEGKVKRGCQPRHTYAEAAVRFMSEYLPQIKPESARRYTSSLKMLFPHFRALHLDQINKAEIKHYIAARKRDGSAAKPPNGGTSRKAGTRISEATIKRDLACLGSILTRCIEWDWIESHPLRALSKDFGLKEAEGRTRYLTKDEAKALLDGTAGLLRDLIMVAIDTGLRKEELLSLTWSQVNLKRMEVRLTLTKSGKARVVPISDRVAAIIERQPRHIVLKWVWLRDGERVKTIHGGFNAACRRAGIEGLTWHDLRHTFASWAIQGAHDWQTDPMELLPLSRWLGHQTTRMTERYAHLNVDDLHRAAGRDPRRHPAQKPAQSAGTETDELPQTNEA